MESHNGLKVRVGSEAGTRAPPCPGRLRFSIPLSERDRRVACTSFSQDAGSSMEIRDVNEIGNPSNALLIIMKEQTKVERKRREK